ncbi:MAG TPA: MFS transporter [Microbacteriaceae bacterium]|nr:MFS transporter [Microbacteriaceae bacterium]
MTDVLAGEATGHLPSRVFNVVLIALNQSTQALILSGLALFLPIIRQDLGLTFAQSGVLAAVNIAAYAVVQLPAGYLADRMTPKRQFLIALIGVSVFTATFALATEFWLLLVNLIVLGVFRSLMFPAGVRLMTSQFATNRRATAMGIYLAGGFSSNIALAALGPVLVQFIGWRGMFIVFAAYGLVLIALQWFAGAPGPAKPESRPSGKADLRLVFGSGVLWLCCWIQFCRFAIASGVSYWLPSFMVEDRGIDLGLVGVVVAVGALITALANGFGGLVSDVLRRPAQVVLVSVLVLGGTIALLPSAESVWLILALVTLQSAFVQVYFGPLLEIPVLFLGPGTTGLSSAIANGFANLGGLAAALTMGWLRDQAGTFSTGFYLLAGLCLLSAAAAVAIVRLDRRRVAGLAAAQRSIHIGDTSGKRHAS